MNYYFNAFKIYKNFRGRASRSEYWYFILFNIIAALLFGFFSGLLRVPFLNSLYLLAVSIPGLAVGARRMHDVGKSGWFLLIPIYNLVLACSMGTSDENEYGRLQCYKF
jgi:uncharacterized membrane protein YhaH (DUF805 family)